MTFTALMSPTSSLIRLPVNGDPDLDYCDKFISVLSTNADEGWEMIHDELNNMYGNPNTGIEEFKFTNNKVTKNDLINMYYIYDKFPNTPEKGLFMDWIKRMQQPMNLSEEVINISDTYSSRLQRDDDEHELDSDDFDSGDESSIPSQPDSKVIITILFQYF